MNMWPPFQQNPFMGYPIVQQYNDGGHTKESRMNMAGAVEVLTEQMKRFRLNETFRELRITDACGKTGGEA